MKEESIKRIGKNSVTLNLEKNKLDDNFISSGSDIVAESRKRSYNV